MQTEYPGEFLNRFRLAFCYPVLVFNHVWVGILSLGKVTPLKTMECKYQPFIVISHVLPLSDKLDVDDICK